MNPFVSSSLKIPLPECPSMSFLPRAQSISINFQKNPTVTAFRASNYLMLIEVRFVYGF